MGLQDDQQHQDPHRTSSDTGDRGNQATSAVSSNVRGRSSVDKEFKGKGAPSSHEDDEEQNPNVVPLACRTFLLTQAASSTGTSDSPAARGMSNDGTVNEDTPLTAALESPSSPPMASAASPESSSLGSPSNQPIGSDCSPLSSKTARKRGVPHIYRDYTNVPDTAGYVRKKTGGVTQPFPEKLHEMLDNVNKPAIVGWLPHGRAFIVRKPTEFTAQIMPKFFRQTKLTSFQRQLNLYGFRRLTQGPDAGAYYHELFLRGRPQLSMRMQRQKVKGTGHKQPADAKTEPNFYTMTTSLYPSSSMASSTDASVKADGSMSAAADTRFEEMSPGMQGLHGAANLLKNIAAGVPASSMDRGSFSLGQSAMPSAPIAMAGMPYGESSTSSGLLQPGVMTFPDAKPQANRKVAPTVDRSMSLLGRVNMDQSNPTDQLSRKKPGTGQSAFFWSPVRRAQPDPPVSATAPVTPAMPPADEIDQSGQQQESAQPSSSSPVARQVEETSSGSSPRSTGSVQGTKPDDSVTGAQQEGEKVSPTDMTKPFTSYSTITPLAAENEGGWTETKVSNGIETEEV